MEKQEVKNITNTLYCYYKSNIDVHIDYLLALNNFRSISHISYMNLAPILESIRSELYKKVEDYPNTHVYAESINKIIIIELSLMLATKGLDDVIDYIAYNMSEKDTILLSISCMLNRVLKNTPKVKNNNPVELTIESMLDDLKKKRVSSNLRLDDVSFACIDDYLNRLRISYDENIPLIKYVYEVISILKSATILLDHDDSTNTSTINKVYQELSEYLTIKDIESLASSIDIIMGSITKINEKHIELHL